MENNDALLQMSEMALDTAAALNGMRMRLLEGGFPPEVADGMCFTHQQMMSAASLEAQRHENMMKLHEGCRNEG